MTMNIVNECIKRPWTGKTVRFLALAFVLAAVLMLQSSTALAITTERVSVDSGGAQAIGGPSLGSAISGDGRYVAFESFATNLVGGDTNATSDIFVRDRIGLATTRVSEKSGGGQATGGSSTAPAITPDGRYVVFHSFATNLTGFVDGNSAPDVFIHDRTLNTTTLVSEKLGGGDVGNGGSLMAGVSDDGRYVVFQSTASNLVAADTNGFQDVFIRDMVAGTTSRVSLTSLGGAGGGGAELQPRDKRRRRSRCVRVIRNKPCRR